jgi:hypothetical protein
MLREFQFFIGARLAKTLMLINAKPKYLQLNTNK